MPDLTDAIRQFDATEANLKRLEELWVEIEPLIPRGMVVDIDSPNAIRYANLCRNFRRIREALPKVDGFELTDDLVDLDTIFTSRLDAKECGDLSAEISVERFVYSQGEALQEYRFRFSAQRRNLVQNAMTNAIAAVDAVLAAMSDPDFESFSEEVTSHHWDNLKNRIAEIDVLKGTTVTSPSRWADLRRHLHFGLTGDLKTS